MAYRLVYILNDRIVGEEPWTGTLPTAQAHAGRIVASGSAQRVEVRDKAGLQGEFPDEVSGVKARRAERLTDRT